MISRPQIFRNRKLLVVHKRFSWRGKVIHRRLRRSTRLPRRRINNFEMGIRGEMKSELVPPNVTRRNSSAAEVFTFRNDATIGHTQMDQQESRAYRCSATIMLRRIDCA